MTVNEGEKPSQLQVTVSSTVSNAFGKAIGTPTTVVSRSSTADYAGGLSMGSPCNEFGTDPDSTTSVTSSNCSDVGNFWANVGSPAAPKGNGDAFQNGKCAGEDGCTGSINNDYDSNGYIYTVSFAKAINNLRLEVFDPGLVDVGSTCTDNLSGASGLSASKTVVTDPGTRYASGSSSKYCTGDDLFSGGSGLVNQVQTNYTVRYQDEGADPTRPWTWPVLPASVCPGAVTYPGYNGSLKTALDKTNSGYQPDVAAEFRQWVTLCSSSQVSAGTVVAVQVKTNGLGSDSAGGHNRFSMRVYSSSNPSLNDGVSLSAFNKMAVYANVKNGSAKFFLTRVPSAVAGQTLTVSLYDIGDLNGSSGTITFTPPSDSNVSSFTSCRATGKVSGTISPCQFTANSTFNGKWETVYIPIPKTYKCSDSSVTGCWVKLNYDLSGVSDPIDTTSWESSIDGQPVRIIQ